MPSLQQVENDATAGNSIEQWTSLQHYYHRYPASPYDTQRYTVPYPPNIIITTSLASTRNRNPYLPTQILCSLIASSLKKAIHTLGRGKSTREEEITQLKFSRHGKKTTQRHFEDQTSQISHKEHIRYGIKVMRNNDVVITKEQGGTDQLGGRTAVNLTKRNAGQYDWGQFIFMVNHP